MKNEKHPTPGRYLLQERSFGWYFTGASRTEARAMHPPSHGEPFSPHLSHAKRFRTQREARSAEREYWGDGNCLRSVRLCEVVPMIADGCLKQGVLPVGKNG